ncbi:hypothetical protein Tco_0758780 [Tanacetum coccineum]
MPSEIPSPLLPLPPLDHRDAIPEPYKRTCFTAPSHRFEIGERSAAAAARQTGFTLARGVDYGFIDIWMYDSEEFNTRHQDAHDNRALLQARISTLEREREREKGDIFTLCPFLLSERPVMLVRHGLILRIGAKLWRLRSENYMLRKMAPNKTPMSDVVIKALIAQGMADALADYEANRSSGNGDDSHNSRSGRRRTVSTTHNPLLCIPHKPAAPYDLPTYKYSSKYCFVDFPDMIQGSVMEFKPITMQEAIEIANDLMDQKVCTFAERQDENKRNLRYNNNDTIKLTTTYKRKNVARRAYTAYAMYDKKESGGSLSTVPQVNYHSSNWPSAFQSAQTVKMRLAILAPSTIRSYSCC